MTLMTHFRQLESVRLKRNGVIVTRRDDDDGPDKFLTISELSKQNLRKKQIELDTVIAMKLQAKEKKQFKLEQIKIEQRLQARNEGDSLAGFREEEEQKDSSSQDSGQESDLLSNRSAVSNLHGRKFQTKFEKNFKRMKDEI